MFKRNTRGTHARSVGSIWGTVATDTSTTKRTTLWNWNCTGARNRVAGFCGSAIGLWPITSCAAIVRTRVFLIWSKYLRRLNSEVKGFCSGRPVGRILSLTFRLGSQNRMSSSKRVLIDLDLEVPSNDLQEYQRACNQ